MRIAQLTVNGYENYGNILQKFALHHTLKKFADSVEVLWNDKTNFLPEIDEKISTQCVLHEERPNYQRLFILREAVRQSKFKDFENLHIPTRFDLPYIEDIVDEYDFFIVGSDQVWNPNRFARHLFLDFVPREKKIAYAVSIGALKISEQLKNFYRQTISDFNYLSVREDDTFKLINELTGQTPLFMPDPVLLLTADEWSAVAQKPTWFKENYQRGFVLTHYLRRLPPPEVKTLAAKLRLPVINLFDLLNYNHFTVGPAEFVWLFAHASLIFTNSFHGVALAILFKRPFINREANNDKEGIDIAARITNLLKVFGMEERRTFGEKIFTARKATDIDFTHSEEILHRERNKAFIFFAEALGVDPFENIFESDAKLIPNS